MGYSCEIKINGELTYYNKLTIEQINELIKQANIIKKEVYK
jgi:hypothetical protein